MVTDRSPFTRGPRRWHSERMPEPPPARAGRGYQLRTGDPDQIAVSVAFAPLHSLVALIRQAAASPPAGRLAGLRQRLRPQSRFAFGSFAAAGPATLPDCCLPIAPVADVTVAEQVARLRDLPGQVLLDELHGPIGDHLPAAWAMADQPGRWLRSWAEVCLDAWNELEAQWRKAGPLLSTEVRRIGTASVSGSLDALLNSLHPRVSYHEGVLSCAFPWDGCRDLGRRRLVLVPMLSSATDIVVSYELPGVAYLAYPLRRPRPPGSASAGSGSAGPAGDPLTLILGPARAAALRALRRPATVNQLAVAIGCAPTTATYHIQQLVAAGLATRQRCGSSVQISRTLRGAELVDLLSS
jgi:DNA-binding transcriptional ArsR family regulator